MPISFPKFHLGCRSEICWKKWAVNEGSHAEFVCKSQPLSFKCAKSFWRWHFSSQIMSLFKCHTSVGEHNCFLFLCYIVIEYVILFAMLSIRQRMDRTRLNNQKESRIATQYLLDYYYQKDIYMFAWLLAWIVAYVQVGRHLYSSPL
jgi:hypothetical protein